MGCTNSKGQPNKAATAKAATAKAQKPTKEKKVDSDGETDDDDDVLEVMPPVKYNARPRASVSAEAYGKWNQKQDFTPPVIPKDDATKQRLRAALERSFIFSSVDIKDREVIVNAFSEQRFGAGDVIIQQGAEVTPDEPGLYMLEQGECAAYKNDTKVYTYKEAGGSFGELALLYNAPRAATVKAETDCLLWSINRDTFNATVKEAAQKKRDRYRKFLKSVEVLKSLTEFDVDKISDAIQEKYYEAGDVIINEGAIGKEFFILEDGACDAVKDYDASTGGGKVVKSYAPPEYFGELALLNDNPRAATVVATADCKCLMIEKDGFVRLLGSLTDLLSERAETMYKPAGGEEPALPAQPAEPEQ